MSDGMVRVDDLLADKYRVERVLGQGGMGYVVAALHVQLEQRVAIKILMPELCEHQEAVERFLREARAAVRIQSEHVARVLDVGTLAGGTPFMVMEFLSGRDLARELDARERLPVKEAVHYIVQACEAVAEAHALGVIHRDLKPANLFLTHRNDGSPLVKVLDFGVAKAIAQDAVQLPSLTATQSVIGSPQYMSPEQVRNPKSVDFRTDVWSLGIVLHELLAGAPPFSGDTPFSLLAAIVSDPPHDVRLERPDVPKELKDVIAKCLEKSPEKRYQNIAELAQALAPHAPDSALSSLRRISRITPFSTPPPPNATTMPSAGRPSDPAPSPNATTRRDPTLSSNGAKDTKTSWGQSHEVALRFRRSAALAIGAGVGVIAALVFWFGGGRASNRVAAEIPSASMAIPVTATAASGAALAAPLPSAEGAKLEPTAAPLDAGAPGRPSGAIAQPGPAPRSESMHAPPRAPSNTSASLKAAPRASSNPESAAPDPLDGRR